MLLPLGQGDDVEVTDEPLERAQPQVGLLEKGLVNADRLADLAFLLVALGLPHLGRQAGHLGAMSLVQFVKLLEGRR